MLILEISNKVNYTLPPIHLAILVLDEQREALLISCTKRKNIKLQLSKKTLKAL